MLCLCKHAYNGTFITSITISIRTISVTDIFSNTSITTIIHIILIIPISNYVNHHCYHYYCNHCRRNYLLPGGAEASCRNVGCLPRDCNSRLSVLCDIPGSYQVSRDHDSNFMDIPSSDPLPWSQTSINTTVQEWPFQCATHNTTIPSIAPVIIIATKLPMLGVVIELAL
jgi:hypothetical protein